MTANVTTPIAMFDISALWESRYETSGAIADRFKRYMAMSRPAMPDDMKWYGWEMPDSFFDFEREPEQIEPFVARGAAKNEDGSPLPSLGYGLVIPSFRGNPRDEIPGANIKLRAGATSQNSFRLFTDDSVSNTTDPHLVTYDARRTNVMSVVWAFEPDWCEAGPSRLPAYFDRAVYNRTPMSPPWMIWLKPSLAALVEPPRRSWNTIVERYADGSLFMATSKETFDCENYTHLEMARAIHRQIDPLNYTVPFDGYSGRSNRVPPFPQL